MNCAFCGMEAKDKFKRGNVTIIAHPGCLEDRMDDLCTDDLLECLLYEDKWLTYGK